MQDISPGTSSRGKRHLESKGLSFGKLCVLTLHALETVPLAPATKKILTKFNTTALSMRENDEIDPIQHRLERRTSDQDYSVQHRLVGTEGGDYPFQHRLKTGTKGGDYPVQYRLVGTEDGHYYPVQHRLVGTEGVSYPVQHRLETST